MKLLLFCFCLYSVSARRLSNNNDDDDVDNDDTRNNNSPESSSSDSNRMLPFYRQLQCIVCMVLAELEPCWHVTW